MPCLLNYLFPPVRGLVDVAPDGDEGDCAAPLPLFIPEETEPPLALDVLPPELPVLSPLAERLLPLPLVPPLSGTGAGVSDVLPGAALDEFPLSDEAPVPPASPLGLVVPDCAPALAEPEPDGPLVPCAYTVEATARGNEHRTVASNFFMTFS